MLNAIIRYPDESVGMENIIKPNSMMIRKLGELWHIDALINYISIKITIEKKIQRH